MANLAGQFIILHSLNLTKLHLKTIAFIIIKNNYFKKIDYGTSMKGRKMPVKKES